MRNNHNPLPHLFLLSLLLAANAKGQMLKNNVYLFDCTESMKRYGLYEPARESLFKTIEAQKATDGATFSIIPFGDSAEQPIRFPAEEYSKATAADAGKSFDNVMAKAKTTNISDALRAGFKACEPNRENRVYLMTDGKPNGADSPEKVAALIRDWCANAPKNTRLFYVELRPDVVDAVTRRAADACDDIYIVGPSADGSVPQFTDITGSVIGNIEELDSVRLLRYSMPGNHPLAVTCSDSVFDAEIVGGESVDGLIPVRILARDGQTPADLHQTLSHINGGARNYEFTINISSLAPGFRVVNPEVRVSIADRLQSRLTIGGDGVTELVAPDSWWHDSFLWSDAAEPGEFVVDCEPLFENAGEGSYAEFRLTPRGAGADYSAWFNGKPLGSDSLLRFEAGHPAILRLTFDTDAKEGTRYFDLAKVRGAGIDIINGVPEEDFEAVSLRSAYEVRWNPLKTIVFWTAAALLAALLLWLAVFRRIFFPAIKVARIELTGPGSYYLSKRVKGARKVELTSRNKSQNILSRLFTGRVLFIRADHFSPGIEALPAGSRKRLRFRPAGGRTDGSWTFTPSATLAPYEKATARGGSDDTRFDISVN